MIDTIVDIPSSAFEDAIFIVFTLKDDKEWNIEHYERSKKGSVCNESFGPLSGREMAWLNTAFLEERDTTLEHGIIICQKRFEVHRHYPPSYLAGRQQVLVSPEEAEGFVAFRIDENESRFKRQTIALLVFDPNCTTARMGTMLRDFCECHFMIEGHLLT